MYVLNKEQGRNKLVFLENTETSQSVCIGKLSSEIMNILGYNYSESPDAYNDMAQRYWALEIGEDTARKLSKLTLPSHKPCRTKTETNPQPKKDIPNLLDILFSNDD